jgi:hypothetical protein
MAQERPIDFSSQGANVFSAPGAQSLSLPSQAAPSAVVATFLNSQNYHPETVASLVVTSEGRTSRTGITHLRFAQEVEGLTVYGTYVKAAVNDAGELVHLIENLATPAGGGLPPAVIGEQAALDAALDDVHPGVSVSLIRGPRDGNTTRFSGGDDFFYRDPTVTRVAIPMESGVLQEGYLVETWTEEANLLHHTLIDGTGRVLRVELRTNNDSYNIFLVHPDYPDPLIDNQTVTLGPGIGSLASPAVPESPIGWLNLEPGSTTLSLQSSIDISGNNAHAYLDVDYNNAPDPSIGFSIEDGDFLTAAQPAQQPNTLVNQEVAVQNLFYFNNFIHDKLYRHGFDEVAGNFQEDNFVNGGLGGDSVNAEAQDGGGFNNANFATPSDGANPRMQMYLWNRAGYSVEFAGVPPYDAVAALFGPSPINDGVGGNVVLVNDGVSALDGGTPTDGCEIILNDLSGKIALIDRGLCDFVVKVQNAQNEGAIGVIVANNVAAAIGGMADNGNGDSITIPSLFISLSDGDAIKTLLDSVLPEDPPVAATLKATHLMRDGDVDSDIIWHEYGHGLTWRMIGGMSGSMSGAIGEGMSDVLSILANGDDVVGEYSTDNPFGIRSAPYTDYPRTYGDFSASLGVHRNGEIYAAIIWRLWQIFQDGGVPQETLWNYLIDGMNYTPPGPYFEDMRDGVLQAASGTGHECLIWDAFAAFGVGVDAGAQIHKKFGWRITEDFDLPSQCLGNQPPVADAGPDQTEIDADNNGSELVTLNGLGSYDPDGGSIVSYLWTGDEVQPGTTGPTPTIGLNVGTHTITLTVTDDENVAATDTVDISVQPAGGGTNPIVSDCNPDGGSPGQRMTIAVTGSEFREGATVDFGERIAVQSVSFVNSGQLDVQIRVHKRTTGGGRNVTVTNPDGTSGTMSACFTVN